MTSIYFRVDGNKYIGTGHIMRCLSIAKEFKKNNITPIFILADGVYSDFLKSKKVKNIILNSHWNDLDQELSKMKSLIIKHKIKHIIIDSYQVTKEYILTLKQNAKITYIDDLNSFYYNSDYLINYNIYAHDEDYRQYENNQLFLGTKFIPLRGEFRNQKLFIVNDSIKNILVTTGGTDQYNFLNKFIVEFKKNDKYKNIMLHIVSGKLNTNLEELLKNEKKHNNIKIYNNISKTRELFESCDIAVSAGGTTVYEFCFCGVPTILFSLADNQTKTVKTFCKKNIIPYSGDIRDNMSLTINNIFKNIDLLNSKDTRTDISKKMQCLADGNGAKRIADKFVLCK